MHFCCAVVTKEFPTDAVLSAIMAPYNDDVVYNLPEGKRPVISWDYWRVGGRYNGEIKLNVNDTEEKYGWSFYANKKRSGRQFRSYLLEKMAKYAKPDWAFQEEDYFCSMGARDGYLLVDGAEICDIQNLSDIGCFYLLDVNGDASERYKNEEAFDEKLQRALKAPDAKYLTILDLHD